MYVCLCGVCVCVRECVRACVCVCVRARACVCVCKEWWESGEGQNIITSISHFSYQPTRPKKEEQPMKYSQEVIQCHNLIV